MRVDIPVEIPVYYRRCARESFALRHVSRGTYVKHLPWSLSVGDLWRYSEKEASQSACEQVPLLVLLTGKRACIYTFGNWGEAKKGRALNAGEFACHKYTSGDAGNQSSNRACSDLEPSYILLRSYTSLGTYSMCGGRSVGQTAVSVEAATMVLPRNIGEEDLDQIEKGFRYIWGKARATALWVAAGEGGSEPIVQYNETTRKAKRSRAIFEESV